VDKVGVQGQIRAMLTTIRVFQADVSTPASCDVGGKVYLRGR
jgi:hypothetical protein